MDKSDTMRDKTKQARNNIQETAKIDVKCHQCGEQRKTIWTPQMECPVCGSKNYQPIIKVDNVEETAEKKPSFELVDKKLNFKFNRKSLKKHLVIIIGLVLLIIWAKIGWLLFHDKLSQGTSSRELRWEYLCSNCNHRYIAKPQIPPAKCPKCGQEKANIVFYCLDCKTKFPLVDKSKSPLCPRCHSGRIISYRPYTK